MDGGKSAKKFLHEALDERGRPLCLLPMAEIWRQNLFHKTAALLLEDRRGKMLLREDADGLFDFSFFGAVPAFMGRGEFAEQVAFENWKAEKLLQLCEYRPCAENRHSFSSVFKLSVSNAAAEMFAMNRQKFLLADSVEISSLMKYGLGLSPFLKLFLAERTEQKKGKKSA